MRRYLTVPVVAFLVIAFGLIFSTPLRQPDHTFGRSFQGDAAITPWFHGVAGQALSTGAWPHLLTDFDQPDPLPTADAFATTTDALLLAPLEIWPGWPDRWGWTLTMAVLLNGLGAMALARRAGCSPIGAAVAGILGVLLQPAWNEMAEGRCNTMAPGLAALALAALLDLLPQGATPPRWWRVIPAALLGALAAVIYPPFLLLLAPAGLWIALPWLLAMGRERRWRDLLPAGGAMLLALLLSGWELRHIWLHPMSHFLPAGLDICGDTGRVSIRETIGRDTLWKLDFAHLQTGVWILGLGAVLGPRRRRAMGLLVLALIFGLVASGPCLLWTRAPLVSLLQAPLLPALARVAGRLHDLDRLLSVAGILLAVSAGLGTDALLSILPSPGQRRPARVAMILMALLPTGLTLGLAIRNLGSEAGAKRYQIPWEVPVTARFLANAPPGVAAELPWDQSLQFRSALAVHRPRLNPLRLTDPPPTTPPLVFWLDQAARGQLQPDLAPEQRTNSGVTYVFWDPSRCKGTRVPERACGDDVFKALVRVLGPVRALEGGVMLWVLDPGDPPPP